MTKTKISATVDPDRLEQAKRLTGCDNTSEVLDQGLQALIEHQLEMAHIAGYTQYPQGDEVVHTDATVWAELPWDE